MLDGDIVLWQSTFTCLLQVTLGPDGRLKDVRPIDRGRGIYFGLTRAGDRVFVAARNTGPDGQTVDPARPTNTVVEFPTGRSWALHGTRGAHQIRWRDGLVWVMNCRAPELVALDPTAGTVVGGVDLGALVPDHLRHPAPAEHLTDAYHFNSLDFAGDRLFVLAHNWGYGSFALELDAAEVLTRPRVRQVHTGLGTQAHDVFADGDRLHVLDSGGGRLIECDGRGVIGRAAGMGFARGLAANRDFFFIGHGTVGRREDRVTSPTYLSVVDRRTFAVVSRVEVGPYGNPCDLLLMSEPDWTDTGRPAREGR
ncbi:MAG TPA: hypothetical protein VM597_39935 [Gemmataceae bacterium]|nr:hypothetical protein [Gemmataceae bacterium]